MNTQQLAELLNNRQYRNEIEDDEIQVAKENNLLVVFGHSDDNVELRGAIYEEYSVGNTILIAGKNDTILIETGTDDLYGFDDFDGVYKRFNDLGCVQVSDCDEEPENYITSEYGMNGWEFTTDLPYSEFEIYDGEDLHGKGLVIDLSKFKRAD